MAITIPDVILANDMYKNINSVTGIDSGKNILILNKSSSIIFVQVQIDQPLANDTNGWVVLPLDHIAITTDVNESCWIRGHGPVCVQEYTNV